MPRIRPAALTLGSLALLPFMPTVPSERGMMTRFARIGIGPGRPFDPNRLDPATRSAIEAGVAGAATNLPH